MTENMKIYLRLIIASIRAKMEYRATFLFMFVAILTFYLGQLGVVLVVIAKFNNINGWSLGQMAFLYGLLVFSQAITTLLFSALLHFETYIVEGNFDRLLLRPLSPLGQMLANNFEISSLAHLVIGVTALTYGASHAGVEWDVTKILFFIVVVAGAVLIQGGLRLAVSAVAFWTQRNRSLMHIFVFSSKEFILYPVSIFNYWVQVFLTLVFPLAFVNFYPSHYFLGRDTSELLFTPLIQYMTPLVGVIFFALAYKLWRTGINRYQSVGH